MTSFQIRRCSLAAVVILFASVTAVGQEQAPPPPPPPPPEAAISTAQPAAEPSVAPEDPNGDPGRPASPVQDVDGREDEGRHSAAAPPPAPPEEAEIKDTVPSPHHTDVHLPPPEEEQDASIADVFGFPFMRSALLAGLMVGAVGGFLGIYVILKRMVFLALALAQVGSAGVALGLAIGFEPVLGSVAMMLLGLMLFSVRWSPQRLPQETTVGIGYVFAAASAVVLIATNARGESHMLDLLFGNILTSTRQTVLITLVGLLLIVGVHVLFRKQLLFTSFDAETAAAFGYRVRGWDFVLMSTIGLAIAIGIHSSGILFTTSALLVPAATALLVSSNLKRGAALAVVLGILPVPAGLYLSFVHKSLEASATIVLISVGILCIAGLIRKAVATRRATG